VVLQLPHLSDETEKGMGNRYRLHTVALLAFVAVVATGCQTLQQIAQLRHVDFALDRLTEVNLAGVNVDDKRTMNDVRATEIARIGASLIDGRLPLDFTLHVGADNPEENNVSARLVRMDWTLFLEDRETISGIFDDVVILPPGQRTNIPIDISLDLVQFFGSNLNDLVEIALSLSGQGGSPRNVRLEATPVIETPVGPLRYPRPITIVSRDVG
jgi:hypothetical protein